MKRTNSGLSRLSAAYVRGGLALVGHSAASRGRTCPRSLSAVSARQGLASDDVITRARSSWRFAHDVLADYAVATRLLEPDGDTVLAQAVMPRRLLRALRLRM